MSGRSLSADQFISEGAQLARDLQSPAQRHKLLEEIADIMADEAALCVREAKDPFGVPYAPLAHPRPTGGGPPLNNTGRLGRGFRGVVSGERARVTTSHIGAWLMQNGGIVRAKRAKFLAIPLTAVAARTVGGPRNFPQPLHARFRKGAQQGILADRKGTAHYALKKQVFVPARKFYGLGKRADRRILDRMTVWYETHTPGGRR